jgi:hypothetical protein
MNLVHLHLGLPSGRFPSGFPTQTFPSFPVHATCLTRVIMSLEYNL